MTVETNVDWEQYSTNGTTGPWTVPFYFLNDTDVEVTYTDANGNDTTLTLNVDYTISGVGDPSGGSITTTTAYANDGGKITLSRVPSMLQQTDLVDGDSFPADSVERTMDLDAMRAQYLRRLLSRALLFPDSDNTSGALPGPSGRANMQLLFDSDGKPLLGAPVSGSAADVMLQLAAGSGARLIGRDLSENFPEGTLGASLTGMANAVELEGVDRTGTLDCTAAVNAATLLCKRIYFPSGTYLLNAAALRSNIEIYGDGEATVLRPLTSANAYVFNADSGSADPANNLTNIYIHDLQLRGWSDTAGLGQFLHLLSLNGVTDVRIERVTFKAARGDGLYLGSGNTGGQERHNYGVTVRKCTFDGVNHSNRNGISVIDCQGLLVDDCLFQNLTDPTMPGPIDLEPNATWNVVRDIKVRNSRFYANGGTGGFFGMFLGNIAFTSPPSGIYIEGNTVDSAGYTSDREKSLTLSYFGDADSTRLPLDCKVSDNTFRDVGYVFRLDGTTDVTFKDNRWLTTTAEARIGATYKALYTVVSDNLLYQIANDNTSGGNGLTVFNANFLEVRRNRFVNCGKADGSQGYAVHFSTGASDNVLIKDNIVTGSNTTVAVHVASGLHTLTPANNSLQGNSFGAFDASAFQAGYGSATYNPPSLAAGASTQVTVSAVGARFNRPAFAAFSIDLAGMTMQPYVSAADQITVVLRNTNGTNPLDLGSGTLSVWAPPV